jgi:hypothetical protein
LTTLSPTPTGCVTTELQEVAISSNINDTACITLELLVACGDNHLYVRDAFFLKNDEMHVQNKKTHILGLRSLTGN